MIHGFDAVVGCIALSLLIHVSLKSPQLGPLLDQLPLFETLLGGLGATVLSAACSAAVGCLAGKEREHVWMVGEVNQQLTASSQRQKRMKHVITVPIHYEGDGCRSSSIPVHYRSTRIVN